MRCLCVCLCLLRLGLRLGQLEGRGGGAVELQSMQLLLRVVVQAWRRVSPLRHCQAGWGVVKMGVAVVVVVGVVCGHHQMVRC